MKKLFETKMVNVEYSSSVLTKCGWRSVFMSGIAKQISDKRVEILEIKKIDGDDIDCYMSRTGASRQSFNGEYFAKSEISKKKNISSLIRIN